MVPAYVWYLNVKTAYSSNSTGPDPVDLAKKKPKNDIDICKVLMLVHLFPKYFETSWKSRQSRDFQPYISRDTSTVDPLQ